MGDENKRGEILKTAEICFGHSGVQNTKLQDIATEMKISKKTIYKYFASKEELVKAVYAEKAVIMNKQVNDIVFNEDLSFVEKVVGTIVLINNEMSHITPEVVNDLKKGESGVKELVLEYLKHAIFERFISLLKKGIENNQIKKTTHIESTGILYRDAIMSFLNMHHQTNVPGDFNLNLTAVQILISSLVTIYKGILTPDANEEFDKLLVKNGLISEAY